jgi:hypothetical protein
MTDDEPTERESYELEPADSAAHERAPRATHAPTTSTAPSATARAGESVDDDDDDLPPPISPKANPSVWFITAGACAALLVLSWLAGAPQLVLPIATSGDSVIIPELSFFERLAGVARTLVFLPLATLGAVFGLLCLAFARQRPVGDAVALCAKCAAIVAVGMLLWLVPSDIRFLKQMINVIGVPAVVGALAIPVFKLAPRDALLTTAFSLMGMLLLVLASAIVVWAVGA